jgi:outer membrane protein OmpA-like peptidoglycan-associated protein
MKTYKQLLVGIICLGSFSLYAQDTIVLTPGDSLVKSSWVLGVGMNIVDDSATPFGRDFLKMKETWNVAPYPSRLSIGRFFKNGIGLEAIGTYNSYKEGKKVDGTINTARRTYYAIDGKISYDLNRFIGETAWFDPYLHVGGGYSSIGSLGRATANVGFGFNTWFNDRWGLNFNTMGKWGLKEGSTKQLQHSAGVAYRFVTEKGLTKRGEEKVALLKKMEEEAQRVQDSLSYVKLAEEAAADALAERLAKEKEQALLAAQEKSKLDAKERLQKAIDDLGPVYFDFDSSYLNDDSKKTLDALAIIMQDNQDYSFQITAHTDSRGPANYNQWLSERRANRTKEYLISKGISSDRLSAMGYGETKLVNECSDGVFCSKAKHAKNRRSNVDLVVN